MRKLPYDKFDLSFLLLRGKAHVLDLFDAAVYHLMKLRRAQFWDAEELLIAKVLNGLWEEAGGTKMMEDIRRQFDFRGDISVNAEGVEKIFENNKDIGRNLWSDEARKQVRALLAAVGDRSYRYFRRQRSRQAYVAQKQVMEDAWVAYANEALGDHCEMFTQAYPGRVLHGEVQRLVKITETAPRARLIDKALLKERIDNLAQMPQRYFQNVSDIHAGRMWHFTGIRTAVVNHVTTYQIVALHDRITCPVCERLDGKTGSVEQAQEKMQNYLSADNPDDAAAMYPFPRMGDIDNKTLDEIRSAGWLPPFHGRSYAEGTEVYTNKGWMLFKNLRGDELFLSPNPMRNMTLEWVPAKRITYYNPKGEMIHLKSQNFDLLVTGNHEQICSTHYPLRTGKWDTKEINEFFNLAKVFIPRTAKWKGKAPKWIKLGTLRFPILPFIRFMAYWLSDGSVVERRPNSFYITIANRKRQTKILKSLKGFPLQVHRRPTRLEFYSTDLGKYLQNFGHAPQKFVPPFIKSLCPELIREFLEAYLICDGCITTTKGIYGIAEIKTFYTSSTRMADDLGELILKAGGWPAYNLQKQAGKMRLWRGKKIICNYDIHRIRWNKTKTATFGRQGKGIAKKESYDGRAYCVELERNHVLWVRYNGKTCFSGNCRCEVHYNWRVERSFVSPGPGYPETPLRNFVMARNMMPSKLKPFLTPYSQAEYKKMGARVFLSPSGRSGYALKPDGDIISVFSLPGAKEGEMALKGAIQSGGTKLDCIGTPTLLRLYRKYGFTTVKRAPWSDFYAPKGWSYRKYDRPRIYYMTTTPAPKPAPGMEIVGNPSLKFVNRIRGDYNKIPSKVRQRVADVGVRIKLGRRITEVDPTLKGVIPQGWSKGTTWDNAEGAFQYGAHGERTVIATEFRIDVASKQLIPGRSGVFNHEYGHAVRYEMVIRGKMEEYRALHKEVWDNLSKRQKANMYYYGDEGECFAESFAQALGKGPAYKVDEFEEAFAPIIKFMKERVLR